MINKHITFDREHDEVLKQIMNDVVGVNNYSEAVRYLCTQYDPESKRTKETKLNAIGKEVSILLSIIVNSLNKTINSDELTSYQQLDLYKGAKILVEETIQKNTTKKSTFNSHSAAKETHTQTEDEEVGTKPIVDILSDSEKNGSSSLDKFKDIFN